MLHSRRTTLLLLLLLLAACKAVDLAAPPSAVITLTASSTVIAKDGGSTEIQATVLEGVAAAPAGEGEEGGGSQGTATGAPVRDGTKVFFFTTLGNIEPEAQTAGGVARVTLTSSGQSGVATVTAVSGGAQPASIEITIGIAPTALTLVASPTQIPEGGGVVSLLATVRGAANQGLPGQTVIFTATPPGVLASGGAPLLTNSQGRVMDTLQSTADTSVSAVVVGTELNETLELTLTPSQATALSVSANPGSLPEGGGSCEITAVVFNDRGGTVPGVEVTFTTTSAGTVDPDTDLTDSRGQARTVLTATGSTTITAQAQGLSDSVSVTVGAVGAAKLLFLTFERGLVSSVTDPGPNPCTASTNPQLPVKLIGVMTNPDGSPADGVTVDLELDDDANDPDDFKGGLCSTTVPDVLVTTTTAVSGSHGAGRFELDYSITGSELAGCDALPGGVCTATVIGTSAVSPQGSATLQIQ